MCFLDVYFHTDVWIKAPNFKYTHETLVQIKQYLLILTDLVVVFLAKKCTS